ncbi:hypothetical protein PAN31117_05254 [Pandoraea anapnoica]|uniref:DUF2269 domain-containing protein n=1 Tax=Pandoraea anapnoica TaxID=2508301 RepID=A0A5E5AQV9_9BURK|nr:MULTISPECIES: DUF2269 domain-containing protein [Pandoraea]VVE59270.1 hypothetical protein PIN31009_05477 [Pandoraea iniqua]VVE75804.1 hypothetical protein PAN31117_05254 [Pandoraea anapnoica]
MEYLVVKVIHILSSVLMVGTGLGSAFYLFFANRSGSVETIAVVSRLVVRADWWFTTPTVIIQPLSGAYMLHLAGYPLNSAWLVASAGLYALAAACWLPVVWIQIRMSRIAASADEKKSTLPAHYWHYARRWELLGYPAFAAMVIIYFLMVLKPQ